MKTIKPTKAWILICSIIVLVSNASEHGPPHHDGSHLGESTAWKKHQNTIVPVGVQTPDHVLSAPDLACLSADDNIFEIMNQAQKQCNGTDIRCTFYHFVNHSYDNIGSVDINKEKFDDLLMKFDNWLLTDENVEKNGGKIKEDHVLEETNVAVNENSSIPSDLKGAHVSQSIHVDVLDHFKKESGDSRVNSHHVKPPHETHHKNHHNKDHNSDAAQHFKKYWKDSNHIVIEPEFNTEHKYFEVYIPKDKVTGKPRTIYVEVDEHKNKFVLLDEEIDKKLKGVKPIRIELDELSDIADTAFNEITKSSNFKEHVHHHLNDDEKAMISDISSGVHEHKIHLDADVSEHMHDGINPNVHHPNIDAIDAKHLLIADDKTGKDKNVLNVIKNQIVPNKYINQSQFQIETHLNNTTDHNIINDHLLETTDNNQVTFYEEEFPLSTVEFNENNIDLNSEIRHNTNTEKSSPNHSDISNEKDNNTAGYHDLSTDHGNVTYNDDHLIELEETNNTYRDIDSDDTLKISAPNAFDLNEPTVQIENGQKENMPKQFIINIEPELNPSVATGTSDYSGSQFHAMPSENRRQGDILNLPLEPPSNISPKPRTIYATIPILEGDSVKVLKTDSPLPGYGFVDLPTSDSQITPRKSFDGHPSVYSYNSPKDSVLTPSSSPTICQFSSPIPPVECAVKLNTESKPSPFNFGFSWMPPKIEELNLPCASNQSPNCGLPNSVSSLSVPSMEYSGGSQSPSDCTTLFKDSSITYNVPTVNFDIQEPPMTTTPCESKSVTPMSPEYILLSKLGSPTPNNDFDRMFSTTPLSSTPCSFKDAIISPNLNQQIPSYLQQNIPCPIDSGLNKMSPFDKNSKDTMIPCPPYLQQSIPCPIDSGLNKISPFDKNSKDTMIPCPPCTNKHPYSANPYFSNPYVKPSQFISSHMAPFTVSKIPTLDSSSMSLDNSHPCQSEDFLKERKPMPILPFSPNNQLSPLNPLMLGPNFPPCPNIWNNVPYLPYYTDRNIRNYAPFVSKYLTPTTDQTYKPLNLKEVPISMHEQPCLANNLAVTPSRYTPCLPVQNSPIQNDLNPSLALERDLENLSIKYGISLSKILNYLKKDMSNSDTCPSTVKISHSNLKLANGLQLNTNANFDDSNRNGDILTLDSTLIGPDLKQGNPLMLDDNQFQEHTITAEHITPTTTQYFQIKNKPDNLHDSSLIGPHISTTSSNIIFNDENRNANDVDVSGSEFSNSMFLDSSLTGPDLKMGRPQVVQGSDSQGEIVASHTEVPIAVSSQITSKLNQNQTSKSLLDTSLIGSHLPSLSPVKPLLSNEIQNMNEMVRLDSELTDLTPKDIPSVYIGNEVDESENEQHEKFYVEYPPTEYLPRNLVEKELQLKDSSRFNHLDSFIICPELETGNLPIMTDNFQNKNIPVVSQYNFLNTETKHEENINLPSSFVPEQKYKPMNTDFNLNINTHGTELNESQPVTQTPLKEIDFKIVEPISNIQNNNILLQESDMSLVNAKIPHENSLIGKSLLPNAEKPRIFNSSIQLDNSLIGPSMLNEIDSQHISTHEQETPIAATTIQLNLTPTNKGINSKYHLDRSLIGPSLRDRQGMESQGTSIAYESVTTLDSSLVPPSLYELGRGTSSVANAKSQLDSSLTTPSLYNTVETAASGFAANHLDSSLLGPSLKPAVDSLDVPRVFDSKKIFDSSLTGTHLITTPDSNEKFRIQSDLGNVKLSDSSLTGSHLNFGNQYDQSDISRYHNSESFPTADVVPGILETTNFLNYDLIEDSSKPSIHSSDLREMLSKFKNSITKSQLPASECKPCDKLLSSIAKQSFDNGNTSPTCPNVQPLNFNTIQNTALSLQDYAVSEYSPNTMAYPQKEFSPVRPLVKAPCLETNKYPISQMSSEILPYAQGVPLILPYSPFVQNIGVPQTPILAYPPLVQINPQIDCNRVPPQYQNIQNSYQDAPGFRPMELSPEELKLLLDLTSQGKLYPQLSIPNNMYSPEVAMIPSSEWTRPCNVLPLDKYMSSLPKTVLNPSHLESTICNPDYSPKGVDIMSLLDENSYKLLQDMSILPSSQSSLTPNTISNAVIPPSSYMNPQTGLYNPQNIPCKIPTPNKPPSNLQPYSYLPSESEFSEIVGENPKTMPLPSESLKPYLQSQSNEYPHTPEIIESIPYSTKNLQQQLPKPCLDSPRFSLDKVLQSPTAADGSNRLPWPSSPPISSITTNLLSNAFTRPILPSYTSPSLISYAKPIAASTTILPLNVLPNAPNFVTTLPQPIDPCPSSVLPYASGPLTPLPISSYTANSVLPRFTSPLKTMPLSDYPYSPTSVNTRPISSTLSPMYASPCFPVPAHPMPINNSPYSPAYTSKLLPEKTNPKSPVFYEPLSAPCSSTTKPISLANVALPEYFGPTTPMAINPIVPPPASILSPSYISPGTSTYNYSPTPAPINTLTNPSSALSSTSISSVSPMLPVYNRPLPSKPAFNLKPAKTPQKLNLQLLNTPISYANNPFLNANEMVSTPNRPIQNQQVPKLSSISSSQVKQYKPSEDVIGSNFQITKGTPSGAIEENTYIYSNDKGDKCYEEPNIKYPLESLSYTLPPEEIKETSTNENIISPEDLIPCAPLTNPTSESSLPPQLYQRPLPTPLYEKPCLPPQQFLPSSLFGTLPQNTYNNIPVVPPLGPFKRPVSLPTSILPSPLLKPLTPLLSATKLPLFSAPCIDTSLSPYQSNNPPLFSSSYNSASGKDMLPSPIGPRGIKKTISSNLTPGFSQFSPFVSFASPISSPKSNKHYNLNNYIELPLTKGQESLVKPSTVPSYNQYSAQIISSNLPSQIPISSPYISSSTTAKSLKKPLISPQYISSTLPVDTTLQDSIRFFEPPINYQPNVPIPTGLTNLANNIFKSPAKPLANTVFPSVKLIKPLSTDRKAPQSISFIPQNCLPVSSLPIPTPSNFISAPSLPYSTITPKIIKHALSNSDLPSSLLASSNAYLQKPLKISSPFNNIPRYNYPSPAIKKPFQIGPYETSSKLLAPSLLPQKIVKPITQYSNEEYTTPLPSSPYQTQSFENIYQPVSNVQYTRKPLPKLSPILSQFASPSSSPIYTSLPSQTIPIPQINKPRVPQYSLPTSSVCNVPSYSSLLNRNPCLNPMPDVSSYPISNNQMLSLKLTPFESNLLSNLRPLNALESLESHSSPITISNPLFTSSLLKPLSNMLSQNPGIDQFQKMPINSQYISPPSAPQLLPCTSSLLDNLLLKPLLTNFQNDSPSVPMPPSNLNTAFPETSPITTLSPATSNQVWSGPELSISELAKTYGPVTPPTIPYDFSKLPLFNFKQNQSPMFMPSNSNYDLQGSPLNLPVKANNLNTNLKPTEVSAISSSESSQLSLETEPVEEMRPCELTSGNMKDTLSKLPINFNQQKQLYPGLMTKYLSLPQSTYFTPSLFKFKSSKPKPYISVPSIIPEDIQLIDTTDFNPISSIKSESLLTDYSAIDKKAPVTNTPSICPELITLPSSPYTVLSNIDSSSPTFKQIPPEPLQNLPSMTTELGIPQLFPYTSPNTEFPSSYKQLPLIQKQYYNNQRPQQSPVYQNSKEYKELTQDLSPIQMSCPYTEPQLTSPLIRGPNPISELPLYTEPMSFNPENNFQLPIFSKSLPLQETAVERKPEIENAQTLLNKNRHFNKITPQGVNNYAYEPKSTTVEVPPKLDYGNPLFKPKEAYTEYTEDSKSNTENNYITESDSINEIKPYNFEAKATYRLPETIKDFNVPDYNNNIAQRPQRLSNFDHFCENNHIEKTPQVNSIPTYNTLPKDSTIDVVNPSTTKYPEILKDLTSIPTKNFRSRSKLDDSLLKPSEYYPEIAENSAKYFPQNNLNPYAPLTLPSNEATGSSEIPPTSFNPYNDMQDIKYSGYKSYQMPSLKSPKTFQNIGTTAKMYNPLILYAPVNPTAKYLNQYQNPNVPRRTEISEPVLQIKLGINTVQESPKFNEYDTIEDELAAILSQYQKQSENTAPLQTNLGLNTVAESPKLTNYIENEAVPVISQHPTPETLTSPLYSKLGFDTLNESPDFNEHGTTKDESVGIDGIKENNDLKTSLINYITKTDEIKNNLDNNNKELHIPLGTIAVIKKEPYEADTITTNNPSIGLKVWKSNAKIVQAELNLKFKDLSVTNFMPVVDNLDKYDMDEIRKIVKNYIDEKYGKHIEIKEPFTIDNQYTVIKDFDHNAVSNKYNLLWPTKYV